MNNQYNYKHTSKINNSSNTVIKLDNIQIGYDKPVVIIAGPCALKSKEDTLELANLMKIYGANIFRGGAYKPRTSPYSFQGVLDDGLTWLKEVKSQYSLPCISEITSSSILNLFEETVDIIQIGARNMQNFELLRAVGKSTKPILLKRGFSNTIDEWIFSAEYIMEQGNNNVIFCERGIRTFETATRNTLDLSVISIIKERTHLPIIIDPSHATGKSSLVTNASLAAITAGADGLMIEVDMDPQNALSDAEQALNPTQLNELIKKSHDVAKAIGRTICH